MIYGQQLTTSIYLSQCTEQILKVILGTLSEPLNCDEEIIAALECVTAQ